MQINVKIHLAITMSWRRGPGTHALAILKSPGQLCLEWPDCVAHTALFILVQKVCGVGNPLNWL